MEFMLDTEKERKVLRGIDLDEIKSRIDASLAAADFYINRYKER